MTEQINQIIALVAGGHVYLQSVYNDTDEAGEPVAGNSYYVGYFCAGAEDATPLPGQQAGQVYETDGIASLEGAPLHLDVPF